MIPESSPQKGASHLRDRRRWRLFLSRSSGDPLQLHLPSTTSEIWKQSRHRRLGNFLCSRCEVYFRLRTVGGFLHGLSCSHFIFLFFFSLDGAVGFDFKVIFTAFSVPRKGAVFLHSFQKVFLDWSLLWYSLTMTLASVIVIDRECSKLRNNNAVFS